MKSILLSTILLFFTIFPAFSELSSTDLDKIKLLVNDVVKKEISESEARLKDYMNVRLESIDKRFDSVDKRITHVTILTYGLIALIVVAVGIPQIISVWQG